MYKDLVIKAANLSKEVYSLDVVNDIYLYICSIDASRFDTEVFVFEKDNIVWVTFRGTDYYIDEIVNTRIGQIFASLKDIFTSTKCYLVDHPTGGKVHCGYYESYLDIKIYLDQYIEEIDMTDKQLVVTGHSMGGALAVLFYADWFTKLDSIKCFTFGQPKVGDSEFNKIVSEKGGIIRYVNVFDIVRFFPGFIKYRVSGEGVVVKSFSWKSLLRLVQGFFFKQLLNEHLIDYYIQLVKRYYETEEI